jgi:hypothetical protein
MRNFSVLSRESAEQEVPLAAPGCHTPFQTSDESAAPLLAYLPPASDSRLVSSGNVIPAQHYADQPYLVSTLDGAWLCVLTTGDGHEGSRGQHIVSLRSTDRGQSWSSPVCIESPDGPEASWAVPLVTPSGRIFVFYVYNADDIRELPADDPPFAGGTTNRMDSHGHYVFRWSDDDGHSWSAQRVTIPVREFVIDRENPSQGTVRLFWNVGRPFISQGSVFLSLHKVGGFGAGWFTRSEGALLRSDDLLSGDPALATWQTLPDGDVGLRTPPGGGPIAEEQSVVEMSDGSFLAVYRSIDGYAVGCYSRDRGRNWQTPRYLTYQDGRPVKHPRAACFAWRLGHGDYVLWYHNHGGQIFKQHPKSRDRGYDDRNPVWMARGVEVTTSRGLEVVWSSPEIILYEDDPCIRMSYPDLREEAGSLYLTETQKATARVHQVSPQLARALRHGSKAFTAKKIIGEAALDLSQGDGSQPCLPELPAFLARSPESPYGTTDLRTGFSLELEIDMVFANLPGIVAEAWHPACGGFRVELMPDGDLRAQFSDARSEFTWSTNAALLRENTNHHVVICMDGGPKIITIFIDGILDDGGDQRQFGWGRFPASFRGLPSGLPLLTDCPDGLRSLRIYPRALLAAEVEALFFLATGPGASSGPAWDRTVNPDFNDTSSLSKSLGATP